MEKQKKIGLFSLILMIFSAIYGFANGTVAYDQMGYASIIWYVLAALFFFLPSALMLAEYGSTFKEAKGGNLLLVGRIHRRKDGLHWDLHLAIFLDHLDVVDLN